MALAVFASDADPDHQLLAACLALHLPQTAELLLGLLHSEEGRAALPASPVTGRRITVPQPEGQQVETLLMLGGLPHPLAGTEAPGDILAEIGAQAEEASTRYAWPPAAERTGRHWRLLVRRDAGAAGWQLAVASLGAEGDELQDAVVRRLDDAGVCQLIEVALAAEALAVDPADMMDLIEHHGHGLGDDRPPGAWALAATSSPQA